VETFIYLKDLKRIGTGKEAEIEIELRNEIEMLLEEGIEAGREKDSTQVREEKNGKA